MSVIAPDFDEVTKATLEAIKKAQTPGIFASTGLEGVDLSGVVAQIPVNVPCRNNTSAFPRRVVGMGSEAARWRALLNINSKQTSAAVGYDSRDHDKKYLVVPGVPGHACRPPDASGDTRTSGGWAADPVRKQPDQQQLSRC